MKEADSLIERNAGAFVERIAELLRDAEEADGMEGCANGRKTG